jgi:hypothetical protein
MFPPVVPAVKRHRLESSPKSRLVTAGAEMMLGGSGLLALSAATGELRPFPTIPMKASVALVYCGCFCFSPVAIRPL